MPGWNKGKIATMNNNPAMVEYQKLTNSTLCGVAKPIFPVPPEFHSGLRAIHIQPLRG